MAARSGTLTLAGGNVVGDSPRPDSTSPQPPVAPKTERKSAKLSISESEGQAHERGRLSHQCSRASNVEKSAHEKVLEWKKDQERRGTMKKIEQKQLVELQKNRASPVPGQGYSAPSGIRSSDVQPSVPGWGDDVKPQGGSRPTSKEGHGTVQYSGPCKKTRMKGLPGSHWTENPMAMEMMKEMSFTYSVPALQPRLTAFHGTRVPVLILFSLLSTEVGRLAVLDTFWKRIVQHPMVWQGIYCRDYGSPRCVWRTLHGRVGSDKCLCHLGGTNPTLFNKFCKQITAIPGRSSEELLETYREWRSELVIQDEKKKKAIAALDELPMQAADSIVSNLTLSATAAPAEPQQDWSVRAHASYGLGPGHGLRIQYSDQVEDPKAVIEASRWARAIETDAKHPQRIGGPPKRTLLKPKASPRLPPALPSCLAKTWVQDSKPMKVKPKSQPLWLEPPAEQNG